MTLSPTILVYSRAPDAFARWLTEHECPGTVLTASSPAEATTVLDRVEVMLSSRFPTELLVKAPALRWIQSMGAGVEDLIAAGSLDPAVMVTRIVGQFGPYIAEYVFAELLARVRHLDALRTAQAERHWHHFVAGTLRGQTMGVAGLGSIGAEVVRKAHAFDMRVHGLSRTSAQAGIVDRHFLPSSWPDFVADLDVLVLTLPRTPETEGVVNGEVLAAMRPHAVIVNVGRGALLDEQALVDALRAGRLGGAILDVFQEEPLPAGSPLWELPGVTVTPHVSGPSTVEGVGEFFLENLDRYRRKQPLTGLVDRRAGY